jgi:hypothetical protein
MKQGSYLWSHHDVASLLGGILHLGALHIEMSRKWWTAPIYKALPMSSNDQFLTDGWILIGKHWFLEMQCFEDKATSHTKSVYSTIS